MVIPFSDDELRRMAQLDSLDDAERALLEECRFELFSQRAKALLDFLNRRAEFLTSNREILELSSRSSGRWARYVDPNLSRSSGTRETTALVLYECPEHVYTVRFVSERWIVLSGIHVSGVVDLPLSAESEEGALEDAEAAEGELHVSDNLQETSEPTIYELLSEEDLELQQLSQAEDDEDSIEELNIASPGMLAVKIEDLQSRIADLTHELAIERERQEILKREVSHWKEKYLRQSRA